ncbi:MAG: UDP-N-acetylmuramoyl-tripeptide--D-alanyl-D-alanine ligase [Candidatus Azotimanducaceae bacterium WSBS_2022_MAG_OTU7]
MNNQLLWSSAELQSAFEQANISAGANGISIDSRTTEPGDLFIALSGDPGRRFGGGDQHARDGHDFVGRAVTAGASVVMVHRDVACAVPAIRVDDTLDGLWQLGSYSRNRTTAKVAAITGSSGKTTLRSWLQGVLSSLTHCHASAGSLNNHWGVPLSLARMPADTDVGLFEIGTNHPGEIEPLSRLAEPDVALVLNVLPAHIGNFAGMDALKQEKLSISRGLRDGGTLVLPVDLAGHAKHSKILTFGEGGDVCARGRATGSGTEILINVAGTEIECHVPFVGSERVESIAALFAVLLALDFDPEQAVEYTSALRLPVGRGNLLEVGGVTIINDSYNANPVSMRMSLAHLGAMKTHKRRIALLGEMLEMGAASQAAHQEMGHYLEGVDQVYTFGSGFAESSFMRQGHYQSVDDFDLETFVGQLEPGDSVLVKGSNKVFWKHNFVDQLKGYFNHRS